MSATQSLDVRPSPRILTVLGDIEFDPWQCIAELVDNAFDDFIEIQRAGTHWPDGFRVSVSLPAKGDPQGVVRVTDSGRGMSLDALNNAVRAGWSNNDRFSKLGLFGMGFNIATARLGRVARVFTARPEDKEWVGVELDLDKIGNDYLVPVLRRPKANAHEHGTEVVIERLDSERRDWLSRNARKLKDVLGDVYSYLLESKKFQLFVADVAVKPKRACIWDSSRFVVYGSGTAAEKVPAVIQIDHELPSVDACAACGNVQASGSSKACSECGGTKLVEQTRRVHGWVGIQRYNHKTDFGIDLLRNGRKIVRSDKRLFNWSDPEDPTAPPEVEYPIEVGDGRIVGQVHLDFVEVNYQKNAFAWDSRSWRGAATVIRGQGPLLPRRARSLNYPENDSPLGRLHRAYRRNDPGRRCLVPGNGLAAIHDQAYEWAKRFYDGEPDYQSDQKWWEAVLAHEQAQEAGAATVPITAAGPTSTLATLGLNPGAMSATPVSPATPAAKAPAPKPETEKERVDRLRAKAAPMPALSKELSIDGLGTVDVTALDVGAEPLTDSLGMQTPLWLFRDSAKKSTAFIATAHQVFRDFAVTPAMLLSLEVAHHLRERADSKMPYPQMLSALLASSFKDLRIDQASLSSSAKSLLDAIRNKMVDCVASNPDRAWQHLSSEEKSATESSMVMAGATKTLAEIQASGEFMLFVPATFLARAVDEWPEAFLDGKVFRSSYSTLQTMQSKQVSLGRIVSYLYDVAILDSASKQSPAAMTRAGLSLQLLRNEVGA